MICVRQTNELSRMMREVQVVAAELILDPGWYANQRRPIDIVTESDTGRRCSTPLPEPNNNKSASGNRNRITYFVFSVALGARRNTLCHFFFNSSTQFRTTIMGCISALSSCVLMRNRRPSFVTS